MLLEKVVDVGEGSFHRPALLHARSHPLAQVGSRSRLRRVARIAEHNRAEVVPVSYTPEDAEINAKHFYFLRTGSWYCLRELREKRYQNEA